MSFCSASAAVLWLCGICRQVLGFALGNQLKLRDHRRNTMYLLVFFSLWVLQKVGFETLVWNAFYNSAVCLWGQCKEPWSSWTKLLFFFCCCKAVSIARVYKASKAAVCRWSRIYMLPEAVYNEVPITIVRYFERAKCHWFIYLSVLLRAFRTVNIAHLRGKYLLLWALLGEPVCVAPGSSGCWGALLLAPKPGKQPFPVCSQGPGLPGSAGAELAGLGWPEIVSPQLQLGCPGCSFLGWKSCPRWE